jgi:hypothetical protein
MCSVHLEAPNAKASVSAEALHTQQINKIGSFPENDIFETKNEI